MIEIENNIFEEVIKRGARESDQNEKLLLNRISLYLAASHARAYRLYYMHLIQTDSEHF